MGLPLYKRLLILVGVLSILAGCNRGPDVPVLEMELQARLDSQFKEDLFHLREFRRTGSAPYRNLDTGESGVYVYYDADIEFLEDYSLTQWQGLNLGTLAFAVGATESGISGFRNRGNSRGDRLRLHGRFSYSQGEDGRWAVNGRHSDASGQVELAQSQEVDSRGAEFVLADARALLQRERSPDSGSESAVIVEEFGTALHRIDLRLARLEGQITLGSGPESGTYHAFGQALSRFAAGRGIKIFSMRSQGSVQNASYLQAGRLEFGLVQSDVAQMMFEGTHQQGFFASRDLRAVASLWPEAVHLLTLERTGIRTLDDIRYKRIAIGSLGSGSRVNAIVIGLAASAQPDELPDILEISSREAITKLEAGELDALFLTEAVPSSAIQALAARRDDLVFVPLSGDLLKEIAKEHFAYYALPVAARTYPGQDEAFTTLGLSAALVTHRQVPDEQVEQVLELLLSGGDELARQYYRAAFISRETMRLGLAVPLHPAAARVYQGQDEAVPVTGD